MNSGLIARILAGGMALSILGVSLRYGSQYDSIQEGIEALKDKGVSFYNQYLVSEEEKEALQSEFETLKTQYLGVLGKLGLGENATLEDVQSKLDSLAQGGANEAITDIAELLGIENAENATIITITEAIADLAEAVTQLEADISRLQTELEQANLDLAQANEEEENTVTALNNALAELNALGGGAPGAGEGEEEGSDPVDPVEPTLEEVQAELDSIWSQFSTLVAGDSSKFTNGRVIAIEQGKFTLDNTDGYKVLVENGSIITIETNEQIYNLLSEYKENLELKNSLLAQQ